MNLFKFCDTSVSYEQVIDIDAIYCFEIRYLFVAQPSDLEKCNSGTGFLSDCKNHRTIITAISIL